MDLKINLATRYFFDTRKLAYGTAAVFVLLLLLTFHNVTGMAGNAGREKRLEADIAALQARFNASAKGVSEQEYQALLKQIASANAILGKRAFDWLLLLDRLETVVPAGVTLTSIDPALKDGSLKLAGTALGFRNLRMFVENLEGSSDFSEVLLLSQGEASFGTTQKGITFNITCKVRLS